MRKDDIKSEVNGNKEEQQLQSPTPPLTRLVFSEEKKKDSSNKE